MFKSFLLFVFLLNVSQTCYGQQNMQPRVKTKLGTMVGTSRVSETGIEIYSFEGIPYIKPPIGPLRFRAPKPADPWTGELNATSCSIMCINLFEGKLLGSEDCVVLNVHTPRDPSKGSPDALFPVMVYIHGGAFIHGCGCASCVGLPDYLLEHDIILVTLSYRLGVMGFLSTEDPEGPGNYGLLDQVEALKWVRDNIVAFGGNPDHVTLFGNSAGSASVHYQMLSPHSRGLFHNAIGQSGVSFCPWANTQRSKEPAQKLAKKVGCPESPSSDMLDCLRTVDAKTLLTTFVVEENKRHGNLPWVWSPRVDSESLNPFLPKHPVELLTTGDYSKVPILMGHTSLEAGAYLRYPLQFPGPTVSELDEDRWDNSCKVFMSFREFFISEEKGSKLCSMVKEHYIDSEKTFEDSEMEYATLLGDAWFVSPIYKGAELMSKRGDVYFYVFDFNGPITFVDEWKGTKRTLKGGAAHSDDLLYLFKFPLAQWTKGSPGYRMMEVMTKIWTDFAKTGMPSLPNSNESWPKASWPNHKYVLIDSKISVEEDYRRKDMEVMEEIYNHGLFKPSFNPKDEL